MSMKPMKPIGGNQQQQVTVDLSQAENIVCKCGNYSYIQSYFLKRISALMSPTGQEAIVPVQVFSCGNCGEVFADGKDKSSEG
tara:strand:+ start:311 stop:559 length:249 start_codon:yes stop_codon:yes gene_type:complete